MSNTPNGPVILLADDDEVVRTMGRDILHILGYQVLVAKDGDECVGVYQEHGQKVGAVILDWHMPGLTGMEILNKLWAINADIKIILATGLGAPREMDAISKTGHSISILQKPYLVKDLQSEIAKLLKP